MKFLYLSDIHIDVNEYILKLKKGTLRDIFIEWLQSKEFDVLGLGGDLFNDMNESLELIDEIKYLTGKEVIFVPGNHDMWVVGKGSSKENYEKYLNHSSSILDKPFQLTEDITIVGGMGWYDYSYKINEATNEDVKYMKNSYWADGKQMKNWKTDDIDFFNSEFDRFSSLLESVKDNKEVWVLTHFVPYEEYLIYRMDYIWNFCNAYMGSKSIGELINSYKNVKKVFFGHTHTSIEEQKIKGKEVICSPVGYYNEWVTDNFLNELEEKSILIEL